MSGREPCCAVPSARAIFLSRGPIDAHDPLCTLSQGHADEHFDAMTLATWSEPAETVKEVPHAGASRESASGGVPPCPTEHAATPGVRPAAPRMTARAAARARQPLDGADAQALEHALTMTEDERDDARNEAGSLRAELAAVRNARRIALRAEVGPVAPTPEADSRPVCEAHYDDAGEAMRVHVCTLHQGHHGEHYDARTAKVWPS